jgi:Ca-activated chloride channel family protein
MSGLPLELQLFHFLRPWLLVLVPLILGLWWLIRFRIGKADQVSDAVASHLRQALTVGQGARRRLTPIDGVAAGLILAALGAAGPTWSRVPDPFVAQTAPLVIVLDVSDSMNGTDVAPSRLERAKQKIRDLLQLRAGARTALVAYAGTAHSVVPMTEDPNVLQPYLEGLRPDIMPQPGKNATEALARANAEMAKETAPGGILFVTDSVDSVDVAALNAPNPASLAVLAMLPEGTGDAGMDQLSILVSRVTPDDADITGLDRHLNAAYRRALAAEGDQPWDDHGWLLAWPAALLGLIWFRRGWTMRWSLALALALPLLPATPVRAEGIADWFLTPDQQGQIAYRNKHYERAAELFADPLHKAYAQFHDGQYPAATEMLARLETPEASFLQGIAYIRNRQYREGIEAFQTTLERDPDFPGAAENLATAQEILDYIETTREQSDTGEDTGEGADDVVFDNKDARGADTQVERGDSGPVLLTADQWMNTVDTDTGDFLRQRFAIEAAQR